jgi:RNA polymerase sigma factor FliA
MKAARSLFPAALSSDNAPVLSLVPPCGPEATIAAPVTAQDIQDFMPLVRQIVARFLRKLPPNVQRDDLIAAGTYGLIDSLRKNGVDRGPTFEWYARIRIRGAILDELRAEDWLTRRARSRIAAHAIGTGEGQAPLAGVVALDDLSEASRNGLCDDTTPSPLQVAEENDERETLQRAIAELKDRERLIVTLHYFHGVQLKTIAAKLGVSEPRVSQLHSRAMAQLKETLSGGSSGGKSAAECAA